MNVLVTVPPAPHEIDGSVLMDGFAGALLGTLIGGLVALWVSSRVIKHERKLNTEARARQEARDEAARTEETERQRELRRVDLGSQFLDAVEGLLSAIAYDDRQVIAVAATRVFGLWARLDGTYGGEAIHAAFVTWLGAILADARAALRRIVGMRSFMPGLTLGERMQVTGTWALMEIAVVAWLKNPSEWQPPQTQDDQPL